MFKRLDEIIAALKTFFSRLSQREQLLVGVGSMVLGLGLLWLIGSMVGQAIDRQQHRVAQKSAQLWQVLALENDFYARKREREQRLQLLLRGGGRLVSWVEDAAKQAGVSIGQLRPQNSEPNAEGMVESKVELRAQGLSIDRLQLFINILENSPNLVLLRRLKIIRPYRRDVADIEMTVSTFRIKAS